MTARARDESGRISPTPESQRASAAHTPARVAVALVTGELLTGTVTGFSPLVSELPLALDQRGMKLLPTERVAYVAFEGLRSDKAREPGERTRVEVVGGRVLVVDVPRGSVDRLGFVGHATDPSSAFSHY